jgi:predicted Zn-dependent protease
VLKRLLEQNPGFEMAYVTLAKVYLAAGRQREGTQVLELLLQRNPKHALGLQILRELKGGR